MKELSKGTKGEGARGSHLGRKSGRVFKDNQCAERADQGLGDGMHGDGKRKNVTGIHHVT